MEIQVCSNVGAPPLQKGRLFRKQRKYLRKFINLLLQNHWARFNQNWRKASLSDKDSRSFKLGPCPFPKGDNYENSQITLIKFKNLLFQNHRTNFNQTQHKAFFSDWDSSLFKLRATPFPRGYNSKISKNTLMKFIKPQNHFQPNLAQSIPRCWGLKFVQMKGHTLFQGEMITQRVKIH